LALGVTGLAGCQHFNDPGARAPHGPFVSDATPPLTAHQAADVQVSLGRSLEKRGDAAQAMAAYQEAIKRDPRRADAYVRLAVLLDRQGKFQDAAVQYRRALELAPRDPDTYCDLGYSLYLQRRWAEAEGNLQHALALKPDHARAHNNLGLVFARVDRTEEALAQFRLAGCDAATARVNLALALTLDRRWAEARQQYEQALACDPACEPARTGLASLQDLLAKAGAAQGSRPDGPLDAGDVCLTRTFFRVRACSP
jgi:Flp pilus assembly protein TadD